MTQRNGQGEHGVLHGCSVANVPPSFDGVVNAGEVLVDDAAK